ncbi:hypothetical protein KL939_004615 [Ogataea angusta]|nr:hypothetical protein KL939_004615 [Ogataea angusta]
MADGSTHRHQNAHCRDSRLLANTHVSAVFRPVFLQRSGHSVHVCGVLKVPRELVSPHKRLHHVSCDPQLWTLYVQHLRPSTVQNRRTPHGHYALHLLQTQPERRTPDSRHLPLQRHLPARDVHGAVRGQIPPDAGQHAHAAAHVDLRKRVQLPVGPHLPVSVRHGSQAPPLCRCRCTGVIIITTRGPQAEIGTAAENFYKSPTIAT